MTTILVTGATGSIGSSLVKALASSRGVTVRKATRDPSKARDEAGGNAHPVAFDWEKPATIRSAAAGVDKVFLLTPLSETQVADGGRLVDAAREAGVAHIVKLSVMGADQEPGITAGRWHREVERQIEASGVPFTFLRPNFFADNFVNYYPPDAEGAICLPFGGGQVSWIDTRDIAEVAARVLTTDGHAGKVYHLSGPAALTTTEVADEIGKASGRAIRYVDVPEQAARGAMQGAGMPPWLVGVMMELHSICKAGYGASLSPGVREVLGRAPRSFADFARDHASAWKKK